MQTFKYIFIAIALLCNEGATVAAQSGSDYAPDEALSARSEHPTLKTNAMMIGVGATNLLDTYLSPEKYRGLDVRFLSHTRREKDSTASISFSTRATWLMPTTGRAMAVRWQEAIRSAIRFCASGM